MHRFIITPPPQVLAFARTNGEQGRKRVPFTAFAKQKKVNGRAAAAAAAAGGGQRPRRKRA